MSFQGYPQGRRKVHILNFLEMMATARVDRIEEKDDSYVGSNGEWSMFAVIEVLLQYDFLVPLLQGWFIRT